MIDKSGSGIWQMTWQIGPVFEIALTQNAQEGKDQWMRGSQSQSAHIHNHPRI